MNVKGGGGCSGFWCENGGNGNYLMGGRVMGGLCLVMGVLWVLWVDCESEIFWIRVRFP